MNLIYYFGFGKVSGDCTGNPVCVVVTVTVRSILASCELGTLGKFGFIRDGLGALTAEGFGKPKSSPLSGPNGLINSAGWANVPVRVANAGVAPVVPPAPADGKEFLSYAGVAAAGAGGGAALRLGNGYTFDVAADCNNLKVTATVIILGVT